MKVLTNNHVTKEKLCDKYDAKLGFIGDKVQSNHKFGSSNNIDYTNFIALKRLKPLIDTFDDNVGKCCLVVKNKQWLLNKLDGVAKFIGYMPSSCIATPPYTPPKPVEVTCPAPANLIVSN